MVTVDDPQERWKTAITDLDSFIWQEMDPTAAARRAPTLTAIDLRLRINSNPVGGEYMEGEYERLVDELDSAVESSPEFATALELMERLAERGNVEAAEAVAEVFAFSDQHRNIEKAYVWYHVALAHQGYSTLFKNELDPPHYAGVVGDFRNEGQVNDLVTELGFSRAQELDSVAQEWLGRHRAT